MCKVHDADDDLSTFSFPVPTYETFRCRMKQYIFRMRPPEQSSRTLSFFGFCSTATHTVTTFGIHGTSSPLDDSALVLPFVITLDGTGTVIEEK
jgi:hypothetical protein